MIDDLIFDWLKLITGYGDQNILLEKQRGDAKGHPARRPKTGDYATWMIISDSPDEYDNYEKSSIDENTVGRRVDVRSTVTVSVKIYAENGREIINKLNGTRSFQSVRAVFSPDVVLVDQISSQNLPTFEDTRHKQVYIADYEFRVGAHYAEQYEKIHAVDINAAILPTSPQLNISVQEP